jgi:hypothetical protein
VFTILLAVLRCMDQVSRCITLVSYLAAMKSLVSLICLSVFACSALPAQGTFRIYDTLMNDLTNGVLYLVDTNATVVQLNLIVENTDSVAHNVTAGRLVLTQPATASNAFTWGVINYPPSADSSAIAQPMNAGMLDSSFQAYYFPNNNGGLATINYCFWETTDMNNYSCVTVTFDNYFPTDAAAPTESGQPVISYGPNPASHGIGISWADVEIDRVDLYSSDGKLISSSTIETGLTTEFELTNMAEGIYYIHCSNVTGFTFSFTFIHTAEK